MHLLADTLTAMRCVFALAILWIGMSLGLQGLPIIVTLTVLAWLTDVLDGPLARRASQPTRLGSCDIVADLSLSLSLAVGLVLWDALPLLPLVVGLGVLVFCAWGFRSMAPLKLAMGLVYGAFMLTVWQLEPLWGRLLVGGVGLVIVLNPQRAWQQVTGFLDQVREMLRREESGVAPNDHGVGK